MKKYWFIQKTYGYGWTPNTLQGWLVLVVYSIAILGAIYNTQLDTTHSTRKLLTNFFPEIGLYTIILLFICYHTGETPVWRWGKKKII